MRKFMLSFIGVLLVTVTVYAAYTWKTAFDAKLYYSNTSRSDTSDAFVLSGVDKVELITSSENTDSTKIVSVIQGWDYRHEQWLSITSNTFEYGDDVNTGKNYKSFVLRGYGTNLIPGFERLRIINTIYPFDSADSTGQASYCQRLLLRE